MNELSKRIVSGVILAPVSLYCIYVGSCLLYGLFTVVSLLIIYEMGQIFKAKGIEVTSTLAFLFTPIILYGFKTLDSNFILFSLALYVLILLAFELFFGKGSAISNTGSGTFLLFYPTIFIASILAIREYYPRHMNVSYSDGAYFIFMIFVAIWACDIFAYFGGKMFGKHKLFPRISPKKTIEGAIFGFIFSIISVILFQIFILVELSLWKAILIGFIVGIFGQIGDLIESLLKRDAGIKDSGSIIPGHGGILDRLDSIIYVVPIIYILLYASVI